MSKFDRKELVSLAELYHKKGLFKGAISYMKVVTKMGKPLNYNERRIIFNSYYQLSVSYIDLDLWVDTLKSPVLKKKLQLKPKVKQSISNIFDEAIDFVDSCLVKQDGKVEAVADCKRFKAFILFYKSLIKSGNVKEAMIREALTNFQDASHFAKENLKPAHPTRLFTEINLSEVKKYLLDSVDKSLTIAKKAHKEGSSSEPDGRLSSSAEKM